MKELALLVYVGMFVALPLYVLNALVMPELNGLKNSYSQAGVLAQSIAANGNRNR